MVKLFKKVCFLLLLLPVFSLIFVEAVYWYNLNYIKPEKIVSQKQFNALAHDVLWVSLGGTGDIEVEPSSATGYVIAFVSLALSYDPHDPTRVFPNGSRLTSAIAREVVSEKNIKKHWHLNNIVVSIWAANTYSATEALDYMLSVSSFGYGQKRFDDAARFYFAKQDNELSFSEVVALMAITKSPSGFSPYCRLDNLVVRASHLAEQLAEFNPEKYGQPKFDMPNFVKHSEIKCK